MDRASRTLLVLAAFSGFMAVSAGAFGAHGVAGQEARTWLQTGGHYQLVHAVAVLACLCLRDRLGKAAVAVSWLFLAGGLVFAGSLYLLALGGPRLLGAITPIGGLLLLLGWLGLAYSAFLSPKPD